LSDEKKEVTDKYGVVYEEDDMGQMVKKVRRSTFVIDKTGMIRAVWPAIEDLRDHPKEIWDFIQKEKS
jgi:peroxiredoxin Q/BCP